MGYHSLMQTHKYWIVLAWIRLHIYLLDVRSHQTFEHLTYHFLQAKILSLIETILIDSYVLLVIIYNQTLWRISLSIKLRFYDVRPRPAALVNPHMCASYEWFWRWIGVHCIMLSCISIYPSLHKNLIMISCWHRMM